MTEAQWLACEDPTAMLEFLRGKTGERKLRLFAAACCRSVWHRLHDPRSRKAVETGERFLEAEATVAEFGAACPEAEAVLSEGGSNRSPSSPRRQPPERPTGCRFVRRLR